MTSQSDSSRVQRIGVLLILAAATGFASKAIFVKLAYAYHIAPLTLLAMRMLTALAILLPLLLWRQWRSAAPQPALAGKTRLALLALGFIGYYLSSLLDFLGLAYIPASLERLILFLYPTLTVLISAAVFRQRITGHTVLALVVSYLGIALVVAQDVRLADASYWQGIALVVASTVSYAFYLVGSQVVMPKVGSGRFAEAMLMLSGGMVLAHFALTHSVSELAAPWQVWANALAMGLFATVLPIYWLAAGIARIGAARAAMLGSVGPVLTLLMGAAILGERLGVLQMLGAALVFVGVWMIGRQR